MSFDSTPFSVAGINTYSRIVYLETPKIDFKYRMISLPINPLCPTGSMFYRGVSTEELRFPDLEYQQANTFRMSVLKYCLVRTLQKLPSVFVRLEARQGRVQAWSYER